MLLFVFGALVVGTIVASSWKKHRPAIETSMIFSGAGTQSVVPKGWKWNAALGAYQVQTKKETCAGIVMFLHGNGADAAAFESMVGLFTERGFDVLVPEYFGYGPLSARKPSIDGTKRHLANVWNTFMSSAETIKYQNKNRVLVGFSLGGAFSYSLIDHLSIASQPTKLVLINTFSGVENMTSGCALSMVASEDVSSWNVRHQHKKWKGSVLVVYSPHDELFGPHHAQVFRDHFTKHASKVTLYQLSVPVMRAQQHHSQSPMLDTNWVSYL